MKTFVRIVLSLGFSIFAYSVFLLLGSGRIMFFDTTFFTAAGFLALFFYAMDYANYFFAT